MLQSEGRIAALEDQFPDVSKDVMVAEVMDPENPSRKLNVKYGIYRAGRGTGLWLFRNSQTSTKSIKRDLLAKEHTAYLLDLSPRANPRTILIQLLYADRFYMKKAKTLVLKSNGNFIFCFSFSHQQPRNLGIHFQMSKAG